MLPALLFALVVAAGPALAAEGLAGEGRTFPEKVYLERTPFSTALNFEACFRARRTCRPFLVTFTYVDADGAPLLYRRLVAHHIDDLARFTAVFDRDDRVRFGETLLAAGDLCCITHPYSEHPWLDAKPNRIDCTVYLRAAEGERVETIVIHVPICAEEPSVRFRLPFTGTWWHLEGHDAFAHHRRIYFPRNTNYFASDFIKIDDAMQICRGEGSANEDFFAFGSPVLAAADGKAVKVIDGIDENPRPLARAATLDQSDAKKAGGNTVIIEHGPEVFSYYAHFKKGSILVAEGQAVKSGQVLGLCGNSGNSDAPHIHFHVVSKPVLGVLEAHGLPAVFARFRLRRGKEWATVSDRSLLAGEIVAPAP